MAMNDPLLRVQDVEHLGIQMAAEEAREKAFVNSINCVLNLDKSIKRIKGTIQAAMGAVNNITSACIGLLPSGKRESTFCTLQLRSTGCTEISRQ